MLFFNLFMIFFGLIFASLPISVLINEGLGEAPFLLIFIVVGTTFFGVGLRNILNGLKLFRIKKIGTQSMGVYICSASNFSMNGVPLYYIKFSFINDEGKSVEVKTPNKYTLREVEFYEKLERFEIKYVGNIGVISQDVDYRLLQSLKNEEITTENSYSPLQDSEERPTIKTGYYFCDYCGNEQDKSGKCKSCGAKITSDNYRERK